jgi:hypothetical protein
VEVLRARLRTAGGRWRWIVAAAIALSVAFRPLSASAQNSTTVALKAAFLYNFAKFAEWPAAALAPGQRLSLCVLGEQAIADALELTISGRAVDGHELTVQMVKADGPLRSCHLLYIGDRDTKRVALVLEALKGAPVLTVGEGDKFAASGGVAQLIVENDRMRFAVNVTSARRSGLKMSSKLLSLATIVKDEIDAQP